jgi:hypothetical protein
MATGALVALVLGVAGPPTPAGAGKTPEALKAEIEALKPAQQAWRAIPWKNCPLDALKEARAKRRPVLTWVFLGNPADERC